jgi:hypothetical protein
METIKPMKNRKSMKTLLLLVAVAVLTCGAGVVSFSQKQETKTQKQQERAERRKNLESYTRFIYRGALDPTKDKLPDLVARLDRDIYHETEICHGFTLIPGKFMPAEEEVLNEKACNAAAVIIGVVKTQTPRLTEDETDIYTINEMQVTTVLKDNLVQSITPGDHINVLRRGGKLEINGRRVRALSRASDWLETHRTYLLFLSFVPEKGFYVASSLTIELKDNKTDILNRAYRDQAIRPDRDVQSFIASVRAAVAAPCDD